MKRIFFLEAFLFSVGWVFGSPFYEVRDIQTLDMHEGKVGITELIIDSSDSSYCSGGRSSNYLWEVDGSIVVLNNRIDLLDAWARDLYDRGSGQEDYHRVKMVLGALFSINIEGNCDIPLAEDGDVSILKEEMRDRIAPDLYNKFADLIRPIQLEIGPKDWSIVGTVIRSNGAIVEYTWKGSTDPFMLIERSERMLAPAGTVPYFGYINGVLNHDAEMRKRIMDQSMRQWEALQNNSPANSKDSADYLSD